MEEEGEGGGGIRLSKRLSGKDGGEVDYKTKSGTAWSHSYLNQKPWHPLSYPNQRRKWIAEQTHAQRQRRAHELAREYTQEQEFLRQTTLLSQKEKEKVDMMQAVSFMYVRPPGYNAESAKAAEIADQRKSVTETGPSSAPQEAALVKEEKKKPRPKDVFGRTLPTEEEFAVLKNAPRLETGVPGRVKPFAVEVRNVKCVRCGNYGHQSGDRECPLKDEIMPNDESRLKREDPLATIVAHMDSSEPLRWELRQKPGISPPRGGFRPDDPNQQIVAEDIFDEYGGFLSGGSIPDLLTNFSFEKHKKSKSKRKHKKHVSSKHNHEGDNSSSDSDLDQRSSKSKLKSKRKHKKRALLTDSDGESDSSNGDVELQRRSRRKGKVHKKESTSDYDEHQKRSRRKEKIHVSKKKDLSDSSISNDSESESYHGKSRHKHSHRAEHRDSDKHKNGGSPRCRGPRIPCEDDSRGGGSKSTRKDETRRSHKTSWNDSSSSENSEFGDGRSHKYSCSSKNLDSDDRHGGWHHRQSRHRDNRRYSDS